MGIPNSTRDKTKRNVSAGIKATIGFTNLAYSSDETTSIWSLWRAKESPTLKYLDKKSKETFFVRTSFPQIYTLNFNAPLDLNIPQQWQQSANHNQADYSLTLFTFYFYFGLQLKLRSAL